MTNPYEPATSDGGQSPPPLPPPIAPFGGLGGGPHDAPAYSFTGAFEQGWRLMSANYGVVLGASAIVFVMAMAQNGIQRVAELIHPVLPLVCMFVGGVLLTVPLYTGAALVAARGLRRGKCRFDDLVLPYQRFGAVALWALITHAALAAAGAPIALVVTMLIHSGNREAAIAVAVISVVVFAVALLFLMARLMFVPMLIADPDVGKMSLGRSIVTSWRLTAACWPSLLGLNITLAVILVTSIFLLCVGMIFLGYPLWFAVCGAAYAMVFNPGATVPMCPYCRSTREGVAAGRRCPDCGETIPSVPPVA